MNHFAYLRVSTADQNIDRQLDNLVGLNIPESNYYIDKQSGKNFERTAWQALVSRLQPGDLLYVHSIDRLGRNYDETLEWWRILIKETGIDIVVLDMPLLDTRKNKDLLGTFLADLVLGLLSYVAQNERETIRKRQAEGIASAKARGVRFGPTKGKLPDNFASVVAQWEAKEISFAQVLERTGLKAGTFYNRLREFRQAR